MTSATGSGSQPDVFLSDGVVVLRPLRLDDAEAHRAGEDGEMERWLSGGPSTLDTVIRARLLRLRAPLAKMPALAKQILRTGYQDVSAVPDEVITSYLAPTLGSAEGSRFMAELLSSMSPQ